MTDEEVTSLYKEDFRDVRERKRNHATKQTLKKARHCNKFPYADTCHFKSTNGNDYFIVNIFYDKRQIKKGKLCSTIGSIIDTDRGKMYIQFLYDELGELTVLWYTAHFFHRYSQRIGLKKNISLEEMIKQFSIRNVETSHEPEITLYKGEQRLMYTFKEGAGMAQKKNGHTVMMTFLPSEILSNIQSERREKIEPERLSLEDEVQNFLKYKNYAGKLTNYHRQFL